jgi:hypothetical protein
MFIKSIWAWCGFVENDDKRRTWGDSINPFDVVVVFLG